MKKTDLLGKVVLVTGGSRGIGKATSLLFARIGATIIVNYNKNVARANEVIMRIKANNGNAVSIKADISKANDVENLVKKAYEKFNRIDVLINNVGIFHENDIIDMDEKIINDIIDTNLKGLIGLTKQVLPQMYKRRSGIIVNVSSALGKIAKPGVAAYCSSKFGVIGFSEALAVEVMQHGIKVYVLCPGGVDTQIHRGTSHEKPGTQLLKPEYVASTILDCVLGNREVGKAFLI